MQDEKDEPLYFNIEAARPLAREIGPEAYGLVVSLIMEIWWPTKEAFQYEPDALADRLTATAVTADDLVRLRELAARFFTVLPDGRWAPSPEFFSITDASPGMAN